MINADVIVIGGGMVGALAAAALANCGADVILLEKTTPKPFDVEQYDLRVSAVSEASERMLTAIGAWQNIRAMRLCPYRRMLVWDSQSSAKTLFNSDQIGRPHLGHIIENRVIQLAIWQQLEKLENVQLACPASVDAVDVNDDCVIVKSAGNEYRTSLLIAADGANSMIREMVGISVKGETYNQHALVATVTTDSAQQDITWQRFTPQGPQALLPLVGHRASMVWYESAATIERLKQLPERSFLDEMEACFPEQLGKLESLMGLGSFPLRWQHAEQYVLPRVALIGDAAHSVHPLAGQGVNMGMLDAAVLAECVIESFVQGNDIGSIRTLRRFERWRKPANAAMINMLDGIQRVFQPEKHEAVWKSLRGLALHAADDVGLLNKFCMKLAMGLEGDLPALARGRLPVLPAA